MKRSVFVAFVLALSMGHSFAISNETKVRILKYAIEVGSDDVAKMILNSKNINLSSIKKSILEDAKKFGRSEIVKILAKR